MKRVVEEMASGQIVAGLETWIRVAVIEGIARVRSGWVRLNRKLWVEVGEGSGDGTTKLNRRFPAGGVRSVYFPETHCVFDK